MNTQTSQQHPHCRPPRLLAVAPMAPILRSVSLQRESFPSSPIVVPSPPKQRRCTSNEYLLLSANNKEAVNKCTKNASLVHTGNFKTNNTALHVHVSSASGTNHGLLRNTTTTTTTKTTRSMEDDDTVSSSSSSSLQELLSWSCRQTMTQLPRVNHQDHPLMPSMVVLDICTCTTLHDITSSIVTWFQNLYQKNFIFRFRGGHAAQTAGRIEISSTACHLKFIIQLWRQDETTHVNDNDNDVSSLSLLSSRTVTTSIVVELQRRRGCPVLMHHLRRSLFRTLRSLTTTTTTTSTTNNRHHHRCQVGGDGAVAAEDGEEQTKNTTTPVVVDLSTRRTKSTEPSPPPLLPPPTMFPPPLRLVF